MSTRVPLEGVYFRLLGGMIDLVVSVDAVSRLLERAARALVKTTKVGGAFALIDRWLGTGRGPQLTRAFHRSTLHRRWMASAHWGAGQQV